MADIRQYVNLLRRMVATPSVSFEESGVAEVISSFLSGRGITHTLRQGNIIAFSEGFDASRPTLALDAHMDTVPAAGGYTRDPYDSGGDDSIVWGLGSNDDGGSVVSLIAAFEALRSENLPFNLMLCITREEERSGPDGARWIYGPDSGLPRPSMAIVGEPTGLKAATSERGLLVLDCEAHGVSGHAARGEGVNALYIALEDISALRAHKFAKVSPALGEVRLTVTQIEAGTAHNVVPDLCRFVVDIRPTDVYTNEEILGELQALCRSTLKPRNLSNRSSATPAGSALMKAVSDLGIGTYSSPTTSDWMRIPCDAVKIGPGESSRSHRPDEYVLVSEIEEAVRTYIELIWQLSGTKASLPQTK